MYKFVAENIITRESDNLQIPTDPNNLYYQQVLDWEKLGNQVTPVVKPPPGKPTKPQEDPVGLLVKFLQANPEVLALVSGSGR